MKLVQMVAVVLIAQGIAGCSGSPVTGPGRPTVQNLPTPPPVSDVISVRGYVYDTAGRPGAGAFIEVLDGADASMSTTAGPTGEFALSGRFTDSTLFRATWEGHVTATRTWNPCPTCRTIHGLSFNLTAAAPPVPIAGNYTVTFAADAGCTGIPEVLRSRTYRVTIAPTALTSSPPGTSFLATATDPTFLAASRSFPLGVAGDAVGFVFATSAPADDNDLPGLVEDLGGNSYLGFRGYANAAVGSAMTTVSTPFSGEITYCALRTTSKMTDYWNCNYGQAIAHAECTSSNHRLIVTSP